MEILKLKSIISEIKISLSAEQKSQWIWWSINWNYQSAEQQEKRMKKIEQELRDLWDIIKYAHIHILWVPEKKERDKGRQKEYLKKYDGKSPKFDEKHYA